MTPPTPARAERVEWDGVPDRPEVDGWHWVGWVGVDIRPEPWRADVGWSRLGEGLSRNHTYHGPVAPPTVAPPNLEPADAGEVERLRAISDPHLIRRHGGWFRPEAAGYTTLLSQAGVFPGDQARRYLDAEGVTIHPVAEVLAGIRAEVAKRQLAALEALAQRSDGRGGMTDEPSTHPLHDPANPATSWALNPWVPMSQPIDLKHLGKLAEELNEAGAAVARCIIQGLDECEPVTRKPNREWLEDELADVLANIELMTAHFRLDAARMTERAERKKAHLRGWHSMLDEPAR